MVIGKTNQLYIARRTDNGFYLQDEQENEVLLPNAFITEDMEIDDLVEAFIYRDSEERLVATTSKPLAEADQFTFLKVKQVNELGAFMDWGLVKDLFVPFGEQIEKMVEGRSYVVFILVDEKTDRLIGSARIEDFVFFDDLNIEVGDEVDLLLFKESELGMNAIVNNMFLGLIYQSDIHRKLNIGEKGKGYVKKIREDGKIDLNLEPIGYKNNIDYTSTLILNKLKVLGGKISLTDKSSPQEINSILGISKKAYKRGVGFLYKSKIITINDEGIELIEK